MAKSSIPSAFDALMQIRGTGILLISKQGLIVRINETASEQFGYKEKDLVGKHMELLLPEDIRPQHRKFQEAYYKKPGNREMGKGRVMKGLRKDGREFPIHAELGYFQEHGEEYVMVQVSVVYEMPQVQIQQQHDKKFAEKAFELEHIIRELHLQVQESEDAEKGMLFFQHLFYQLVNNYPGGSISVIDQEFQYVFCGGMSFNDLNMKADQMIGQRVFPLLSARQWKSVQPLFEGVLNGEKVTDQRIPGIWEGHHFSFDAFPLKDYDGRINRIGVITRNVSTLKQTVDKLEEQVRQTEKKDAELQEALRLQKLIFDNSGAMMVVASKDHVIRQVNAAVEKVLGYKTEELVGKKYTNVLVDEESMRKRAAEGFNGGFAELRELYENRMVGKGIMQEEFVCIKKNGTRFPASVTATMLKDSNQNEIGYLLIAFDISMHKKVEGELQKALKRERELSELKSRFVTMASHEFRTPLSTVLSSAFLLERYTESADQPRRKKHTDRIISSVNTLTDILNDFLSLGKFEEGKVNLNPVSLEIDGFVNSVIAEMENNIKKEQVIRYEHQGPSAIRVDITLMKNILLNLLTNASKFSPENSCIRVNTFRDTDKLILKVKDEGIGISQSDQDHLFERFFRGANVTNIQGTGLGLHIVSKYVELMQGTIRCVSTLGEGTEFILEFNMPPPGSRPGSGEANNKPINHEKDPAH